VDGRAQRDHDGLMDHKRLYDSASHYFDLDGDAVMKLTPKAAVDVCLAAAERGLVIVRIEGGFWHSPGFEARLDCIWDGADPPLDLSRAMINNARAAEFVQSEQQKHDAFIITDAPLTGYRHKQS
jgi:hypothetical protein